jgi:hypothetical protein
VLLYKKRRKKDSEEKTAIEKKTEREKKRKKVHNNGRVQERLFQHPVTRRLAAGAEPLDLWHRCDTVSCIAFPPTCSPSFLLCTCDQQRYDVLAPLFNFALLFELC